LNPGHKTAMRLQSEFRISRRHLIDANKPRLLILSPFPSILPCHFSHLPPPPPSPPSFPPPPSPNSTARHCPPSSVYSPPPLQI
jgi:hypothetical protein